MIRLQEIPQQILRQILRDGDPGKAASAPAADVTGCDFSWETAW
jgi:hypothetical protein